MRTIVLWDIDNTLLYSGGAGSLGMARAFSDLYGVDDAFGRVEFSGRTDTAIFTDAALAHGIAETDLARELERFRAAYVPHLESALPEVRDGRLMPGIEQILEALSARHDVAQGLGTGNFRSGGELKLRHFGIDHHFHDMLGGFGEHAHARDAVIRIGIERLADGRRDGQRVVVIGDTPHDISAARANGAVAIGVATGRNSVAELVACGADVGLEDLSDVDETLRLVCGD